MVEPITLATTVVSFLAPYLAKAGESMAKKAGDAAWEKLKQISAAVKKKLQGDAYAEQTLQRLEKKSDSESRQAALVGVLEEKIQEDASFAQTLKDLVAEAKEAGGDTIIQQVSVSGHAQTGDITTVGKIEGGRVDLSKKG